jgi:hypothetical protein
MPLTSRIDEKKGPFFVDRTEKGFKHFDLNWMSNERKWRSYYHFMTKTQSLVSTG